MFECPKMGNRNNIQYGLYQQMVYPYIPSLFFVGIPIHIVPVLIAHFQCQWISCILTDLHYSQNDCLYHSQYLPNQYEMNQWIQTNHQNTGKRQQHLLADNQFSYILDICKLSKQSISVNLEKLKNLWFNRDKPRSYIIKSRL